MQNIEIFGFTIDRDENAARNLEYLSTPLDDKHLTGVTIRVYRKFSGRLRLWRYLWRRNPPTNFDGPTSHVSLKQEADTKYSPGIFG